jgi:hypothetical protein
MVLSMHRRYRYILVLATVALIFSKAEAGAILANDANYEHNLGKNDIQGLDNELLHDSS